MPINECPHYPPAGATNPTYRCSGCAAIVSNPASAQAVNEGKVEPSGAPRMLRPPGG